MNTPASTLGYHLVAFVTVAIWGSTFVFTKMLLLHGFTPAQIFTLRFLMAYVLLLTYELLWKRRAFRLTCTSWQDELIMVLLGVTGGSLYFLCENAAMLFTTATNTSLIVCSCPLFAMLLAVVFFRHSERFTPTQMAGSLVAFLGMAVVVLNGRFVLHLSPLGDLLAFGACVCWAVYSLLMKPAMSRYSTLFITRKVFFYGLLTIVPYYLLFPAEAHVFLPSRYLDMTYLGSVFTIHLDLILYLLFLGFVASMLCFLVWNWVLGKLGAVIATNWVYFNPIVTILFAWWLLNEQITPWFVVGTLLILVGMYLCDRQPADHAEAVA